jgi:hypothetical protein
MRENGGAFRVDLENGVPARGWMQWGDGSWGLVMERASAAAAEPTRPRPQRPKEATMTQTSRSASRATSPGTPTASTSRRQDAERDAVIAAAQQDGRIPDMPTVAAAWADAWDRDPAGARRELEALPRAGSLDRALASSGNQAAVARVRQATARSSAPAKPAASQRPAGQIDRVVAGLGTRRPEGIALGKAAQR